MSAPLSGDLLIKAFRRPASLGTWNEEAWQALLDVARYNTLLPKLWASIDRVGILSETPEKAAILLQEAVQPVLHKQTLIRFEIDRVRRALAHLEVAIVLLKGAAYLVAELPTAKGRSMVDLDILVPREKISTIETALIKAGWKRAELSAYDVRYYRDWMHEVPAFWHPERRVTIDLHHTIIPPISRFSPDTAALFEAAIPLETPHLKILSPADMVLHAGAHLFHEEFALGLRDLLDIRDLLQHFGQEDGFWSSLVDRARLHGLERTLFYLLRYTKRLLGSEMPEEVETAARKAAPPPPLLWLMDWLFTKALTPAWPGRSQPGRAFALWLLYLRSHWLKMPASLLIRHLSIKAWRRLWPVRRRSMASTEPG